MDNKNVKELINQIICGDVLEVLSRLPSSFIDLGITSPPYNKKGVGGENYPPIVYKNFNDKMKEEDYQKWQIDVLDELYRVIKDDGYFFYNHKVRYEKGKLIHPLEWITKSKWNVWQEIIWYKKSTINISGWRFWQTDERIYWLVKGKPKEPLKTKHTKLSSVWEIRPEIGHKEHPAPFPIELPTRIIHSVLEDKQGIVIDPFCGTGTTLVSAFLLGKYYIGIDISEEYVEYAKKRLENAEKEKIKVLKEISLHVINITYKETKAKKLSKKNEHK